MDIGDYVRTFYAEPSRRAFVVSVKQPNGDWMTLTTIELRIAQPIAVHSDTGGVVAITAGATDPPLGLSPPPTEP